MSRFSSLISVFVSLIGFAACGTSEVISVKSDAGTVALDSDGQAPVGDVAGKDHDYQTGEDEVAQDVDPSPESSPQGEDGDVKAEADTFETGEDTGKDTKEVSNETHDDTAVDSDNGAPDETQAVETEDDTVIMPLDVDPSPDSSPTEGEEVVENDEVKTEVEPVCAPDCVGKECGSDGCGGSCGACDDDINCTFDMCDVIVGQCLYTPQHALCDNGNVCDGAEKCVVGIGCQPGVPINCDDNNQCTNDVCQNGLCINTPLDNWTSCELDGLACSVDNCWNGKCKNIDLSTGFDEGEVPNTWGVGEYGDYNVATVTIITLTDATTKPQVLEVQGTSGGWATLVSNAFTLAAGHQANFAFDYKNNLDIYAPDFFTAVIACASDGSQADIVASELVKVQDGIAGWVHYKFDLSPYTGLCYINVILSFPYAQPYHQMMDTIQFGCL